MKKRSALVLCLLLLLSLPVTALAAGREHEHVNYIRDIFNEEKGLPSGEANAVVQTPDGYLWVGGYGGLTRYNGSTFQSFNDRLVSYAVRTLFVGSDGALYIGTNGDGAYRLKDDVFTHLQAENTRSFLTIRGFAEDADGTVYLASPSGAARIDGDTVVPFAYGQLSGARLLCAAVDAQGNLWALSDGMEIFILNGERFLARYPSTVFFEKEKVYSLCADAAGDIFIGSNGSRIVKLSFTADTDPRDIRSFQHAEYDTGDLTTVNNLSLARDGSILVGGLNGFGILGADGGYRTVEAELGSISANASVVDDEGNLWVASSNYGIVRYTVGCFDSCNYNSDLAEYPINAVAKAAGRYYLGTDGGLLLFDEDWNRLENDLTAKMEGIRIRNVTVDTRGRVWMATYSRHGAMCYDPATDESQDFGASQGLNSETIRVVYPLSDGRMLVGNQLGVNIIENGAVTASYGAKDGMETTSVLCAMELNGRIYVGTDGSGIYEITDGGLVNLGYDQGLTEGVVLRMEPDADGSGNYFVCASDKLFYCENDQFRRLTGMELDAGSIFSLYDVDGRLWMLQNGGVASVDKAKVLAGEAEVYTAHYGVKCGLTGTLNANTWNWLDENGALYIPTRRGVSLFYFRGPGITMPRAILSSVTVDGQVQEHPTTVELPRDAQRVTIDVAELLFSDTSEYILAYRLDGFDTEDTRTMDKRVTVSYTNLHGGEYALKLRVIDPITGESSVEQSVPIVKAKQLREQAWFYVAMGVLAVAVIAGAAWLILRQKTRNLMKKQEEQRRYIDDITKVFSQCVDMRDPYTNGHSARVAKYTAWLAEKLGKSKDEVDRMYHIALLHDVGKISIPDAVLNKPSRLTDEEYQLMRSHAQRGYDVLQGIGIDPDLALGAGCHHERYDGKGYPRGLKGDEIPEVAQIIGVADTFDAMYSTRPYRKRMPLSDVVAEIKKGSGTQLSPKVVDAFLELVEEGAFDNE